MTDDPVTSAGRALDTVEALRQALRDETDERRRAECMGQIQDQAAQLALDLIVKEPRHRRLLRRVHAQARRGDREPRVRRLAAGRGPDRAATCGWRISTTALYTPADRLGGSDDSARRRCPSTCSRTPTGLGANDRIRARRCAAARTAVRAFNEVERVERRSPSRHCCSAHGLAGLPCRRVDAPHCERSWQVALLEAIARQATLVLHQSRARRPAPARGSAQGRPRGAQPAGARHPRHAGAGLRRHPDAAAGGAARRHDRCRRAWRPASRRR